MKKIFTGILLFVICSSPVFAQQGPPPPPPVADRYPAAIIYVIDPQTGQETPDANDDAILFKNAFIDLVMNTNHARFGGRAPGHKSIVITQADPSNGNVFQLTQQSKIFGQMITNFTFSFNVDQNTLYYFDPNMQSWVPELVQGYNVVNLNNCLAYGKFNEPNNYPQQPAGADAQQQQTDAANADQNITTNDAPPPLQDEVQPDCPVDGYLWQPGYWAYSPGGYYWVAGEWVAPPTVGYLWTPPYWGFEGGLYIYHRGYWGTSIGFYGGVYYGYGYTGRGYVGGGWYGGHYRYNTAVVRVGPSVHNVYVDRTVVVNNTTIINNRVSYNGGAGGTHAMPTAQEKVVMAQPHVYDHKQDPKAPVVNRNNNNQARANNGNVNRPGVTGPTTNANNRPVIAGSQNGNRQSPQTLSTVNKPGAPAGNRPPVPQGLPSSRPAVNNNNNNRQVVPANKPANNNKPVKQPKQNDTHDKKVD